MRIATDLVRSSSSQRKEWGIKFAFLRNPICCVLLGTGYAEKWCTGNGNWSRKRTDYVPCGPVLELSKRTRVHIISYAISAAALFPALVIFYSYK